MSYNGAKNFDMSTSMGPCIVVGELSAQDVPVETKINGQVRQSYNTSQMIFSAPEIVSFVSRYTTLEPGDIICTGTCAGVAASSGRFLQPGDQVVGAIEKLGELRFSIG